VNPNPHQRKGEAADDGGAQTQQEAGLVAKARRRRQNSCADAPGDSQRQAGKYAPPAMEDGRS
jgi:hypothetical protein